MKYILLLSACLCFLSLSSQEPPGVVYPGGSFVNQGNDTLFYLSKNKMERIMEKEKLQGELIRSLEERVALCDSMLDLKTLEAEKWHQELVITDEKLEELEIKMVEMQRKSKLWKRIWFGVGVVLGGVVGLVV